MKLSVDDSPAVHFLVADVLGPDAAAAAAVFDYIDAGGVDAAATFVRNLVDITGTAGTMSDMLVLHVAHVPVDASHRQAFVIDDIVAAVGEVLAETTANHAVVVTVVLTDGNDVVLAGVPAASWISVAEVAVLDMILIVAVAQEIADVAKKMLAADCVPVVVAEAAPDDDVIVYVADAVTAFVLAVPDTADAEDAADIAMSDSKFDCGL